MAFMDLPLDAPEKADKGLEGGACNRRSCQTEPALWYNHGSLAWYCESCARDIGLDPVNKRHWERDWQPKCGHPQFETREMMDARSIPSAEEIEAARTPAGGWTREQLAKWGVPWPPPKGWKTDLLAKRS